MLFLLPTFCQPVQKVASTFTTWLSAILGHKAPLRKENVQCSQVPLYCRNYFPQAKANCSPEMWGYIAPCSLFHHPNQHIPHILSKCGTEHRVTSNGGFSNPFTSASLGTNWIKVMLFGFSLPGRQGAQLAPCQQGSVVSASILDQHSAYLHLLSYGRSAWGKVASWEKKILHVSWLL